MSRLAAQAAEMLTAARNSCRSIPLARHRNGRGCTGVGASHSEGDRITSDGAVGSRMAPSHLQLRCGRRELTQLSDALPLPYCDHMGE